MNNAKTKHQEAIDLASDIVAGKNRVPAEFARFKALVARLKGSQQFGLARKLLAAWRGQMAKPEPKEFVPAFSKGRQLGGKTPDTVWLIQQQALCTYKDEELQPAKRFAEALRLLEEIGLRNKNTTNAETLSLGGAVYRRMWEQDGKLDDLYRSLSFYQAAWEGDENDADRCYGGVNAAFIHDQMAFRLRGLAATEIVRSEGDGRQSINAQRADDYGKRAIELRRAILAQLDKWETLHAPIDYWFAVTRADAYLGLALEEAGLFPKAVEWYGKAAELLANEEEEEKEWRLQSTFKQALSLARLHGYIPSDKEKWKPVGSVLTALLGEEAKQALTCQRGKVGLALSGGGFRASFYHLGVMARLAEMDVLRGVDVLSTVSGGSIVGAHYYLEVQRLLENNSDSKITREDYIQLIRNVQRDFLIGVQRNLRMRALANFISNLRMIWNSTYSRTNRLGELYEKEIYSRVNDGHSCGTPRNMPDLLVKPASFPIENTFKPRYGNWRRTAKVPVLLLNTTSLNTGHNWHFTASWMGEPPGVLDDGVDANERYRRLYYHEAPNEKLKKFRLGYAVAASSCVPGLFEPICIPDLYENRAVRLVDGGVHDNQGTGGLLDEGCTRILCSDASGQMQDEKNPANNFIGVPLRSSSISQDRVREAEYQDLRARVDSHALEGLFFIHLKKDLETEPVPWIGCTDPHVSAVKMAETTTYGINKDVQRLLANMRTDLDSFTEVEANALMLSGYLMAKTEFEQLQIQHENEGRPGKWGDYDIDAPCGEWEFLKLKKIMSQPRNGSEARNELEKQLEASSVLFFKIWHLSPMLKIIAGITAVGLVTLACTFLWENWGKPILPPALSETSWGWMVLAVILGVVVPAVLGPLGQLIRPTKAMRNKIVVFIAALAGWVLAKIHLGVFDRMYLKQGRLKRLLELSDE